MDILNFNKLSNDQFIQIKQNIEDFLNIIDLQTYTPIYFNYEEIENKNETFIFKNKYFLKEILTSNNINEIIKTDPYIKNQSDYHPISRSKKSKCCPHYLHSPMSQKMIKSKM